VLVVVIIVVGNALFLVLVYILVPNPTVCCPAAAKGAVTADCRVAQCDG
jgi:hypothetical protein